MTVIEVKVKYAAALIQPYWLAGRKTPSYSVTQIHRQSLDIGRQKKKKKKKKGIAIHCDLDHKVKVKFSHLHVLMPEEGGAEETDRHEGTSG